MIPPKITQLPPAPVRADAPVDFSSKADAMVGALQPFADEANILAEFVNTRAENAESSAASVAGVQSAVSADRVLSQQAASNAAGSAAAAASSASTASNRATAAQQAANASEASAVRAEDAADYVEGITDGAAPLNSPLFTGNPRAPTPAQSDNSQSLATTEFVHEKVGTLGTAATRNMGTGATDLRQNSQNDAQFVAKSQIKGVTGQSNADVMSQKATTDAIAAAVADALENIDASGPRPTKDHGPVATAGSETVVCNVQESDFHILDMSGANATGTLTIDFANMPDTVGKHFSWHVRLQRGGRKTVAFAQTINWAGGVAPSFGAGAASYDVLMFYKVGDETIRGMTIDAW